MSFISKIIKKKSVDTDAFTWYYGDMQKQEANPNEVAADFNKFHYAENMKKLWPDFGDYIVGIEHEDEVDNTQLTYIQGDLEEMATVYQVRNVQQSFEAVISGQDLMDILVREGIVAADSGYTIEDVHLESSAYLPAEPDADLVYDQQLVITFNRFSE